MRPFPAVLAGALLLALPLAATAARAAPAPAAPPVAVVELFTSEGCSSCPPAEELLARLDADARTRGRNVVLLEFHVDYWDQLGWRDVFASPAGTARQRDYAARLGLDQVYTPQMIVNGRAEFVGSNAARAGREIDAALARPAALAVTLEPVRDGSRVRIRATLAPAAAARNAVVLIAETETPPGGQDVARGENAGRRLHPTNVVRAFGVARADAHGVALVDPGNPVWRLPVDTPIPGGRLVAVAQDRATGAILGAASVALPAGPAHHPENVTGR